MLGSPERVPPLIEAVKAKKQRLFGYGHRIYKKADPRTKFLRDMIGESAAAAEETRSPGAEEDARLAEALATSEKERSENLMIVDLVRNDLGRVCVPGTVRVHRFFDVERYSHVMHLVSTVSGRLAQGCTAFDAVTACFPAGTLSGAPKPKALAIIEELEPTRRGLYGGIVGYLDFAGNADTAIAIRTALVRDGVAYVQAGGGIVADSDPHAEDTETLNKARAVLSAIATAEGMRELP